MKASAGASEWVAVAQVTNLARSIEPLKEQGYWVYAAAADGDRADKIDFTGKVALVLGSEGKGVRRNVLEHCDRTVSIPMFGHVDSFNVASAAAVLCYEVVAADATVAEPGALTTGITPYLRPVRHSAITRSSSAAAAEAHPLLHRSGLIVSLKS